MNNEENNFNNNLESPEIVPVTENNEKNTIGIVGFILSFFIPLVGLILSIIGLNKSKKLNGENKGLSVAGIIISSLVLFARIIIIGFFALTAGLFIKTSNTLKNGVEDVTNIIKTEGFDDFDFDYDEDNIKVKVVTEPLGEQTFNGITVKVEDSNDDWPGQELYINNNKVFTDDINKYAFVDKSVVILHGDTSWAYLSIYNTETEKLTFETVSQENHYITSVPEYLSPTNFYIEEDSLEIQMENRVGQVVPDGWQESMCQLSPENININVYKSVTFEMDYLGNGNFGPLEEEDEIYMNSYDLKTLLCS